MSRHVVDVADAAVRGLALGDGVDLHAGGVGVGVGGGQVEVGEPRLLQVVEVPLGERVPGGNRGLKHRGSEHRGVHF